MATTSAVLVVGVGAWQTQNALSTNHSSLLGTHPVTRSLDEQPATASETPLPPGTAALAPCGARVAPDAVQGVISIPKLGIQAPVLQGTDDAELNVGVGHDPDAVWPGAHPVMGRHPQLTPGRFHLPPRRPTVVADLGPFELGGGNNGDTQHHDNTYRWGWASGKLPGQGHVRTRETQDRA